MFDGVGDFETLTLSIDQSIECSLPATAEFQGLNRNATDVNVFEDGNPLTDTYVFSN